MITNEEQRIEELEWFIKEFKEQKEEIRSLKRVLNSIKNVINISLLEPVKPTKPSKIEKGYNIDGKLIVSMKDLEGVFTWDEAMEEVKKLGEGWRLPTKEELNLMYLHKDKIGGFVEHIFWSSTEGNADCTWVQDFSNGYQYYYSKDDTDTYVRAVRSI